MDFYSVSDLGIDKGILWQTLGEGTEVVLTNHGKPSAIMMSIPEGAFDETVQAVRQAKAMIAINSMRGKAAKAGFMTDEEINSAIAEARA